MIISYTIIVKDLDSYNVFTSYSVPTELAQSLFTQPGKG